MWLVGFENSMDYTMIQFEQDSIEIWFYKRPEKCPQCQHRIWSSLCKAPSAWARTNGALAPKLLNLFYVFDACLLLMQHRYLRSFVVVVITATQHCVQEPDLWLQVQVIPLNGGGGQPGAFTWIRLEGLCGSRTTTPILILLLVGNMWDAVEKMMTIKKTRQLEM